MGRITQTGENSIIEARMLYHRNSYAYILLLFGVKYKFMTLWLNTTCNSAALSRLLPFMFQFPHWSPFRPHNTENTQILDAM